MRLKQPNFELIGAAKESLTNNWGIAIGGGLIMLLLSISASFIPGSSLIISGPLSLGFAVFSLTIARGYSPTIEQIFSGFNRFGKALGAYLLYFLVVLIGFIFFIIPGIMLAFGLSQVFFILADDDQIGVEAALRKSWEMMKGYKLKYFGLMMIFAILSILSVFTLFIGLLFIVPLYFVSTAKFYEDIRGEITEENVLESNLIG